METTMTHQIKVGIFAAIGLVLFCLSVILLGGDKFFFSRTYTLKIHTNQVQGLGKGSVVSVSGVPVGNIEQINFIPNSPEVEINLTLQKSVENRITEGSLASVKTQGAPGDKYIYIEPGPPSAKPLAENAVVPVDKTPDFLDLIASKGSEMGEIVDVIKEIHILFKNINADGHSAKLMTNLVNSSEQLNKFLAEGRETLVPLSSVMKKLDNGQGTLGALINDPSLHNRLLNMLGEERRNKFLKPLIRDSIQTNEQKGR
jgi:phospholipid/cholesterol/gamma-HCH transport system substrate-binding protein